MGYRRGTQLLLQIGAASLCFGALAACSSSVSHPSALGSATEAPAVVVPVSPTARSVSGSPSPGPAGSASASVTASPSRTPTSTVGAPPDPTSANVVAVNVRATARAFIDDFNIALATGDVTKIEALTSPTCGCRTLVNTIKAHSAKGERYDGVAFTLKSIDVTFLAAGASGEVKYSISAGRIVDAAGKEVSSLSATPDGDADLFVNSPNGRWIVQQSYLVGASRQ